MEAAVTEKLERLEAKRYGKTNKPRKSVADADLSPGERGIRRGREARRMDARSRAMHFRQRRMQALPRARQARVHHNEPFAPGGDRSPDNVFLLCRQHKAYLAELDYGKAKMDPYRACEPKPTYGLSESILTFQAVR